MNEYFPWRLILIIAVSILIVVSAFYFLRNEPADFTFCNNDEVKTIDPAQASGNTEERILTALFEGLTSWHPKTLEPLPAAAESWEISDDKKTYTFHIRKNARWSDGSPVTSGDFRYSFRRFLHPETASEYAYELWYVPNAQSFSSSVVTPGDNVEIELTEKPSGARPFAPGIIVKGVLKSIDTSEVAKADKDNPVYRVTLKDGTNVEYQKNPAIPERQTFTWFLRDFDDLPIRTPDDHTLTIELEHPVPYFLYLAGFYPLFPVQQKCIETYGSPAWTRCENIVSNGPYVLESRRIRDRVRLRKNPYYWDRENVSFETIDALAVKSAVTSLNLYLAGDCDWIPIVPPEVAAELATRPEKDYINKPFFASYYYIFNLDEPCFKDVRVRRALNMALDKREFVERVTRGGQVPATSLVPPLNLIENTEGASSEASDTLAPIGDTYNVERAQQLLAEAGYPGGEGFPTIEILYNTLETHETIALLVQHQWKKNLGINVRLQNQEWADYLAKRRNRQFQLTRAGWNGDYPDPITFLLIFTSTSPMNQTGWKNERFDQLIEQSKWEPDLDKRNALLREAETILAEEAPCIPFYYYASQAMVRNTLDGWYPNLLDTHPLKWLRRKEPLPSAGTSSAARD